MLKQAPVLLARRIRRLSVPFRLQTKPLSLVLYAASQSFFPSRLFLLASVGGRHWRMSPPPVTALVSSALPRWELRYFSISDMKVFRSPGPDFLTGIVLRSPTMGERVFVFPKKRQGGNVSRIIFFTPVNAYPVSQVTCCRNIHSGWIARTTAA